MDVFSCLNYQQVLTAMIEANRSVRGYQKRLAEAAGCHTSYLSQVRAEKVHLTPDHAAGLAVFWQLDEASTDYFLSLVQLERAGSSQLKTVLKMRLRRLKSERQQLSHRVRQQDALAREDQLAYYNTWRHSVVHMAAMVPGWQNEPFLAKRLGLPLEVVQASLMVLERLGLMVRGPKRWEVTGQLQHLGDDSPMLPIHQANFRELARARTQIKGKQDIQYSAVYALSNADLARLKDDTTSFIDHTRQVVIPSPSETIACLVCDIFEL